MNYEESVLHPFSGMFFFKRPVRCKQPDVLQLPFLGLFTHTLGPNSPASDVFHVVVRSHKSRVPLRAFQYKQNTGLHGARRSPS